MMVNIGEISKPSVDPGFDKNSKIKRSADKTGQAEAVDAINPLSEKHSSHDGEDRFSLSNESKKYRKKKDSKASATEKDSTEVDSAVTANGEEPKRAQSHIDITI